MRTVVVVPTYNESENIAVIVSRLRTSVPDADVLIVDDASPDGTGEIADALALRDSAVRVLHRAGKGGLGSAYRAGFDWAIGAGAEIVVEMDADGSHRPEQLPRLLEAIDDGADVVLGSRWVAGGQVVDWPLRRQLLSRGGSLYARVALGLDQRDVTGGYRAFRTRALAAIDPATVESQGYCFQIEMLWRAADAGLRIREVPITFAERERGSSKMSSRIVIEAMTRVTGWMFTRAVPGQRAALDRRAAAASVRGPRVEATSGGSLQR